MNWLDVVLLILIAVGAIAGYRFGLIQSAASFVAVIIGIALASRMGNKLTPLFELVTEDETAQEVGGFVLVLLVIVLLGMIASSIVMKGLGAIKLGWLNSVGGLGLGALLVMMACSAALANVQEFSFLAQDQTIEDSTIGTFLADNFDIVLRTVRIVPKDFGHY